ncbi:MAG TPA: hypothetical protein VLV25_01250 [Steroidobacteraceae bacterium]|nr:hypothetical protein [Steroidobacteraceae bacterium]
MSRLKQLQARRRVLLGRCDEQREELAARVAALSPAALLQGSGIARLGHPLVWAALAAMLLFGRTRRALTAVLWVRSVLAFARRATHLMRLLAQARTAREGD